MLNLNLKRINNKYFFYFTIAIIAIFNSSKFNVITFGFCCLLFIIYIFINNKIQYKYNKWLVIYSIIYLPFFIYGLKNPDFHIDFKYHLFILLYCIIYLNTAHRKLDINNLVKLLYYLNIVIFVIYVFLFFFSKNHNIYSQTDLAGGYSYRVSGPDLISFTLFSFLYIVTNRKIDKQYYINVILGLITILLNGSLQHFVVFTLTSFIYISTFLNFKTLLSIMIVGVVLMLLIIPYLNEKQLDKITYIYHPWDYPTFKYRIWALKEVIHNSRNTFVTILFGEGVGIKTTYFEPNITSPSLSRYRTFLEIDNGFYYVYHRGGLVFSMFFLITQFAFISILPNFLSKVVYLMIFIVTNTLSIHYFTTLFYINFVLFSYSIVNNKNEEKSNIYSS